MLAVFGFETLRYVSIGGNFSFKKWVSSITSFSMPELCVPLLFFGNHSDFPSLLGFEEC